MKNGCYSYKMTFVASSFRDQVFTKEENKDYRDFTAYIDLHIEPFISFVANVTIMNCIKFSLSHFACLM